jgi:cytoskeletal protein CcmA (bactofilin family)
MTVFSRNEKVPDPLTTGRTPTREKVDQPVPAAPDAYRAQVPAQGSSNMSASQVSRVSVISKALKITGQLESTEDIQIEGEVEGDVRAVSVKVGGGAKVKGTVYGEQVELAGTVDGKIEAKKVMLTSTARMSGDVIHQEIMIESGAFIDGHCKPEYGKSEGKIVQPLHKIVSTTREPSVASAQAMPSHRSEV